ncbi:MAG: subtype I-C CRISPR-associated endonuclease Cas1 [Isosphaera sp.]|nr:subtype I-C CRISPR-associated endonuclease Cas1 [Isosphaera sp.]
MAEVQLNTLYVVTRGATVRRDGLTLQVVVERAVRLTVPVHQVESVAAFGGVHVTPGAMALCAEHGAAVTYLTESGRLVARVDAPGSGNVLLRRAQYRLADDPAARAGVARCAVAGKVQNGRNLLLRAGREAADPADRAALAAAAARLAGTLAALEADTDADTVRGREGDAAREYFGAFGAMVRVDRAAFAPAGRTRRPPLDRMNALLSFLYSLLTHDCAAACAAAGLDPSVGFLHVDRPGRPGLALDLVEEFRPLLADRTALALVNRQQVRADGFEVRDGGAVWLSDGTRRTVLAEYQRRKREEVTHPYLGARVPAGRLPFLQARVLARHLRGDLPCYVPCVPKN